MSFRKRRLSGALGLGLLLVFSVPPSFALGKKKTSDPVVHIPPSQRSHLKVLSLNFNSEDVLADWDGTLREQRFAALIDWVEKSDPDILMIQEAWNFRDHGSVAVELARALDYDVHYRIGMGAPGLFYDSNIILAKKQYRMSERQEWKLAHSAWDIGDGKEWTLVLGRVTYGLGVKLMLPTGEPVYVYTSHLIGNGPEERFDQIRDLRDKIHEQIARDGLDPVKAKIVLGGDLNSEGHEPVSEFLRGDGFTDSWLAAHPGDESCTDCADPSLPFFNPITIGFGQFPDQSHETESERLDYVYARGGLKPLASTLQFSEPFETVWMSDHYGVLSSLSFDGGASETVPNPTHDASSGHERAEVLDVTDSHFHCGSDSCSPTLSPLFVRNSRGLVIRNGLKGVLRIEILGPGTVLTLPHAELKPRHSAGFVFETSGRYQLTLDDGNNHLRYAFIEVNAAGPSEAP